MRRENDDEEAITEILIGTFSLQVKMWDLGSNQTVQVAAHEAPVKVVRWVKAPNYTALMSCSWDKTIKFWDTRSAMENSSSFCRVPLDLCLTCIFSNRNQCLITHPTRSSHLVCSTADFSTRRHFEYYTV